MQYRFIITAIALSAITYSCSSGNNRETNNNTTTVADTATHARSTGDRTMPPPREQEDMLTTYRGLIQGNWYDESDPKSTLIFTGDKEIMLYDGKALDTLHFEISYTSCMDGSQPDTEKNNTHKEIYLQTDLCYSFNGLDNNTLSLLYLSRGNTLVYKRKK